MKKRLFLLPETLFLILVLTIPIQLGKHFWPSFAHVLGLRVDFLSPTIFATDIVIFLLVLSFLARVFLTGKFPSKGLVVSIGIFLLTEVFATIFSKNFLLSSWSLVKFFEFSTLAIAVSGLNYDKLNLNFPKIFTFSAAFSVVLATLQFWQQKSLSLWILGERSFNLVTPGIAKVELLGTQILRPYATFPHPNVLAGFLVISAISIFFSNFGKFTKLSILSILIFGLFLTFSRSAWLSLAAAGAIAAATRFNWQKVVTAIIIFLLGLVFLQLIFPQNPVTTRFLQLGESDIHSLVLRKKLADAGLAMFFENLPAGVGLGNFIPSLPKFWDYEETVRFLQPVHNIPLLVLAETGLIGAAGVTFLIAGTFLNFLKNFKQIPAFILPSWVVIILISNFDHYFWTLQQGQILFWTILGLTWAKTAK